MAVWKKGSQSRLHFLKLKVSQYPEYKDLFNASSLFVTPKYAGQPIAPYLKEQISQLTTDEIRALKKEDLPVLYLLSPDQLNLLDPKQVKLLAPFQIPALRTKTLVQSVPDANVKHIEKNQLDLIDPKQVKYLNPKFFRELKDPLCICQIPDAFINTLKEEQVQHLQDYQLQQLKEPRLLAKVDGPQLEHIELEYLIHVPKSVREQHLSKNKVNALKLDQHQAVIADLTDLQKEWLSDDIKLILAPPAIVETPPDEISMHDDEGTSSSVANDILVTPQQISTEQKLPLDLLENADDETSSIGNKPQDVTGQMTNDLLEDGDEDVSSIGEDTQGASKAEVENLTEQNPSDEQITSAIDENRAPQVADESEEKESEDEINTSTILEEENIENGAITRTAKSSLCLKITRVAIIAIGFGAFWGFLISGTFGTLGHFLSSSPEFMHRFSVIIKGPIPSIVLLGCTMIPAAGFLAYAAHRYRRSHIRL